MEMRYNNLRLFIGGLLLSEKMNNDSLIELKQYSYISKIPVKQLVLIEQEMFLGLN
jgi:hypothetical protein